MELITTIKVYYLLIIVTKIKETENIKCCKNSHIGVLGMQRGTAMWK